MFETLKKLCIDEINTGYDNDIMAIKTADGLERTLKWYGKAYVKNPEKKLTKFIENRRNKALGKFSEKISVVENAPDFAGEFIITVEWKKSHMWGSNPVVCTNNGFEHRGISGCGYDKLSTATAYALNSDPRILKLLYQKKESELNRVTSGNTDIKNGLNTKVLGYGAGYGILPAFECGVGVSCHEHILNSVGLTLNHVSATKNTDVYIVRKMDQ